MTEYTPLVGVKWTKQRMLKVHDLMWSKYMGDMMKQKKFSKKETIKRIDNSWNWIGHIRHLCIANDIAFKKKDKKKKT